MSIKDRSQYQKDYNKENYTICKVVMRASEVQILTEYCDKMDLSKSSLLQKCMMYCYKNDIDVSKIKLSKPEK